MADGASHAQYRLGIAADVWCHVRTGRQRRWSRRRPGHVCERLRVFGVCPSLLWHVSVADLEAGSAVEGDLSAMSSERSAVSELSARHGRDTGESVLARVTCRGGCEIASALWGFAGCDRIVGVIASLMQSHRRCGCVAATKPLYTGAATDKSRCELRRIMGGRFPFSEGRRTHPRQAGPAWLLRMRNARRISA
ncbi:uncharacterized protein BJ171DRAFT_105894 [Polychytrium aggregatum]|uniref:uncharacterized protein n=1 Tax=Polychytrium aggregatum TaxID=110093 RepID=UPI0022FDF94A|nr:uncharacterized protein BJ171DRAFT_105894 [Polychytrium aggregatum]KAI9204372.1 hypothetical protein BJ171DRAFT_105894 [Polychytrium aggregatum]